MKQSTLLYVTEILNEIEDLLHSEVFYDLRWEDEEGDWKYGNGDMIYALDMAKELIEENYNKAEEA